MRSEQLAELVRRDAGSVQDASQSRLENVSTCVDRHGDGRPAGMLHDVMAAADSYNLVSGLLQSLDYLCSPYGRDGTRHNAESYQKSGNVERQLAWDSDLFDQAAKSDAQVLDSSLRRLAFAECRSVREQVSRGGPEPGLLVLLKAVVYVNGASHVVHYIMEFIRESRDSMSASRGWDVLGCLEV